MNNTEKYYGVEELYCWDCHKVLEVNDDGSLVDAEKLKVQKGSDGTPSIVIKCKTCYDKNNKVVIPQACEVYSRVVGYLRPVTQWNEAKQEEFKARKVFKIKNDEEHNTNNG
jgi:hypothetical protein